tara:strand:- start:76 stop:348 length:273 start_codon:yes stop_codon:yes gene_type:complete
MKIKIKCPSCKVIQTRNITSIAPCKSCGKAIIPKGMMGKKTKQNYTRMSILLEPSIVNIIGDLAEKAGRNKSELIRYYLSVILKEELKNA